MAVLQFPAVFAALPRPKGSPTNSLTSSRRGIRPQASPSPSPLSSDRRLSSCSSSALSPLAPLCARKPRVLCRIGSVRCEALGEGPQQTFYQGIYGPWTVEPSDVREVILYRCGLVTAAASFVIAASTAFLPDGNVLGDIIKQNVDFFYATGGAGLGLSLFLIHIYVTPIKRFLQSLWAIGAFGSVVTYISLARPLDESLIQYVIDNPVALWFVGPLFAALTGLVFKEGLCYGKLEAGVLTFIIPGLLLGHLALIFIVNLEIAFITKSHALTEGLFVMEKGEGEVCVKYVFLIIDGFFGMVQSGLMDNGAKLSLLSLWMALFVVFATRKFQQPIKDDIGDKSVFMFNALPEEEKKALIQKLEQ